MQGRPLALVALVLLAGCAGTGLPAPLGSSVDADNPWGERTLHVALETDEEARHGPLLEEALAFWEANAEEYADYPIRFERVDAAVRADVVVAFVGSVDGCEDVQEAAGCAPLITEDVRIERPERVEVLAGLSNASTVRVLKHEFGHVLGLDHDDEPAAVMEAGTNLEWQPMTNATERPVPWRNDTLSVYVDYANVPVADRDVVRRQVRHALRYYESGAAGHVPANVSFVTTDDRATADVVIGFPNVLPCGTRLGSCGTRYGTDPDADGVPEWFTGLDVALVGIDPSAVGWHVGYWLGYGLGFDEPSDWPAVFRDATAAERRSDWWADATFRPRVAAPA